MPARMTEEEDFYTDLMEEVFNSESSLEQGPVIHTHRHNLRHRFELIRTLGEGTYGKVKLAIERHTQAQVAIKYIKKTKICDETDLTRLRREIKILTSLNHPNIVNVQEVFENKDRIILVMDCATEGELYDYINQQNRLQESDARRIFRQIAAAVHYCHQNGVVHRDLKLENIVLDEDKTVKIADFGLSNYYAKDKLLSTYCGSPLYASPEIVNGKPYEGPEIDCWSMGVILYTLVYGAMPFDSSDFKVLRKQISTGDYFEPTHPSDAAGLIRHLLMINPAKRATVDDVLNHWWVNFGFKKTPNGEPYPNPEKMKPMSARQTTSLSSDSEGEPESKSLQTPLKGILKKPKSGSRSSEESDSTMTQKSPLSTVSSNNTIQPADTEVFCNETASGDDVKKVFDSQKKPARGILKRKGKFSGGDSGCVLNDGGAKSPSSDTKENLSMAYNLSDIESVLSGHDDKPSGQICRNEAADFVCSKNAQPSEEGSVYVVPRRGILKKPGQNDSRKRLSTCSTGSNSSADILDFSYDSSDDNALNMFRLSMTRNDEVPGYMGAGHFETLQQNGHYNGQVGPDCQYGHVIGNQNDDFYNSEEAQKVYRQALQIGQKL